MSQQTKSDRGLIYVLIFAALVLLGAAIAVGVAINRSLARAVSDQGFGQARRMLGYKTTWNGGTLIPADRWFPSSKTCSGCGAVKAKLALSERTYVCTECGLVLDRAEERRWNAGRR